MKRISTGSPQDLFTRTRTRLCKGPGQHFTRISTRSAQRSKIFMPGPGRKSHKIDMKGPAAAAAGHTGHLEDFIRTSSTSAHKDLHKIKQDSMSPGCPQGLPRGTCTRSCEDFLDDFSKIFKRSPHKGLHNVIEGSLREDFTRISTRSSRKSLCKVMEGLIQRGLHQDLYKSFSQRPVQDHALFP